MRYRPAWAAFEEKARKAVFVYLWKDTQESGGIIFLGMETGGWGRPEGLMQGWEGAILPLPFILFAIRIMRMCHLFLENK